MTTAPVFDRMFQVPEVFGVSDDQVRKWVKDGIVKIVKRGRMSFVRTEEMARAIERKQ